MSVRRAAVANNENNVGSSVECWMDSSDRFCLGLLVAGYNGVWNGKDRCL